MLNTPINHFNQDIDRARALNVHAQQQPPGLLKDDILRLVWMMGVGACDAYFSDAYADLVSRALRAKDLQPTVNIPDRLNNLKVPVIAVIRGNSGGWRWRMAARELIENENVLSLEKVKTLFNHFCRKGHKVINQDTIESWILHRHSKVRFFGITPTVYRASNPVDKAATRKAAVEKLGERFEEIFQRRHDCIHNCDRPRVALQRISHTAVAKVIDDIEFLVQRCHEAFLAEFPVYLQSLGFSGATRNQVCG